MLGSRDSGKEIACDAISTACDKNIAIFHADSLMFDKNSGDAAKTLSWDIILKKEEKLFQIR